MCVVITRPYGVIVTNTAGKESAVSLNARNAQPKSIPLDQAVGIFNGIL
jgi:hypothetical protein